MRRPCRTNITKPLESVFGASPRGVSVLKLDAMKNSDTDISDSDLVYKAIMDCLLIKRSA